jgi:Flp pilus assembly protein TadD
LVAILMSLSLMAKAMLVTLPCVLLLLDYWPLGRLSWRACVEKIPLFLIVGAVSVLAVIAQGEAHAISSLDWVPLQSRASNAAVSYVAYLAKLAWPQHLAVLYPHPMNTIPLWRSVSALASLATITAGVVWTGRSRPYLIVGWLWFLGTLVPVMGLIQVGVQAMADRFVYFPAIGIYLAVVRAVLGMTAGWRYRAVPLAISAAGVLLALLVRTDSQVRTWRDSKTVFEHALRITSNNYIAHINLGLALLDEGNYDAALVQGRKALAIRPDFSDAHRLVGHALARQGKLAEAAFHYAQRLGVQDQAAELLREKGDGEAEQGRLIEAMRYYREALDIRPEFAEAHKSLADVLLQLGRLDDAIEHYSEAIRLNPNWTEAQRNLSEARNKIQKK